MTLVEPDVRMAERPSIMNRLRDSTAAAHKSLETDLAMAGKLADREAMRTLLQRFWGFHAVWEPAVAALLRDPAFFDPRRKLVLIGEDLLQMGLEPDAIAALPVCADAAPAEALGSLYVLEGSTLGGQVITRMLKGAGWAQGLRYFDPYGADTGARWRAFRQRAEAASCATADAAMVASAQTTFAVLRRWLTAP